MSIVLALTTIDSERKATALARELVQRQLAACVHIFPKGKSIYMWEDKLSETTEWQLLIKTNAAHIEAMKAALQTLHSYLTPELLFLNVQDGAESYLKWISDTLTIS